MSDLNKFACTGRLTADPVSTKIDDRRIKAVFSIAVNRVYKVDGENREDALFLDVETWNEQAKWVSEYLHKGVSVWVEGRLAMDRWDDKEGGKHTKVLIRGAEIGFAGVKAAKG